MGNMRNDSGKRISVSWSAGSNQFVRCPYPGCTHSGLIITKVHCRQVHGMERDKIGKLYGMPEIVEARGAIISKNNGRKWDSTNI